MNYELKNKYANQTRSKKPIVVVLVFLFVVLAIHILNPKFLPSILVYIVRPFWKIETEISSGNTYVNVEDLIKKNDELEKILTEKSALFEASAEIKKENEELKNLLGRKINKNFILAQILVKPPFSPYDSFILDIGEDHGLKKGNMVFVGMDIPIGQIVEVYRNTSRVRLYSSPGEKFNALVSSKNILITAYGKGGGTFRAELPRDAIVVEGDSVTIPSISNSFLGKVEKIVFEPSNPFSTILFSQPINLFEQRWVEVEI